MFQCFVSQVCCFDFIFVHFFIVKLMRYVIIVIKLLCMYVCVYIKTNRDIQPAYGGARSRWLTAHPAIEIPDRPTAMTIMVTARGLLHSM